MCMAKWTCMCGNPMDDHKGPDENFYRVFSDIEWNEIEPDEEGKVDFREDIPVQTYDAYKCPVCGRLMIFGDGNAFKSYVPE